MSRSDEKEIAQTADATLRDERPPEAIAPEHLEAVQDGLAQARRRQFAPHERVQAVVRRLRP